MTKETYSILLDFVDSNLNQIQKDKSIGLYSFVEQQFIHYSQV